MSWARLDDSYDTNTKILQLGELQRWRWTRVLLHCARHRTDGKVDAAILKEYGLARSTATLIKVGLLDVDDAGAYVVHDWTEFNPTGKTERQARWRAKHPPEASTQASTSASTQASTSPSTEASTSPSTKDADVDTESVYSRVGTRARPVPYPLDQDPSFLPTEAKDPPPEQEKAGRRNLRDEDRIHPFDLIPAKPEF